MKYTGMKQKTWTEKFVTISTRLPIKARLILSLSVFVVVAELSTQILTGSGLVENMAPLPGGSLAAGPVFRGELLVVGKVRERKHLENVVEVNFENQLEDTEFGFMRNNLAKLNNITSALVQHKDRLVKVVSNSRPVQKLKQLFNPTGGQVT